MNDIEFFVFDYNLNLIGSIDSYEKIQFNYNYYNHSTAIATIEATDDNIKNFIVDDNDFYKKAKIIVRSDDVSRGFLVETAIYTDDKKTTIEIYAYSLSTLLSWRQIYKQQVFSGTFDAMMKYFVSNNCINVEQRRIITNLSLGPNSGLNNFCEESFTSKQLDLSLWEVSQKYETTFEILLNHQTKKLEFVVSKGLDRSALQNVNPTVAFSKEYDNVFMQSFTTDMHGYKNTAFVYGEGIGKDRYEMKVGEDNSGWNRRELSIDARDLQKEYTTNGGTNVVISEKEYLDLLKERGINKLEEFRKINSFESKINPLSQFIFNEDYFLGDIVTNINEELGIMMHRRIVSAIETFDKTGYNLDLEFGDQAPTLLDKLKRGAK